MARNRHTAPATTGSAQHEDAEQTIRDLRDKIEWLDALAQEAAGDVAVGGLICHGDTTSDRSAA